VNYTRDYLFIGLNRLLKQSNNSDSYCISYPSIYFLYDDISLEQLYKQNIHGIGYGYSRRLQKNNIFETHQFTENQITELIEAKAFDYIVFGKIGVDEGILGSIDTNPYWKYVNNNYNKDNIVFLYGEDSMKNMADKNSIYTHHLLYHSQFGKCFVRELSL
jgi:hypothetical protein